MDQSATQPIDMEALNNAILSVKNALEECVLGKVMQHAIRCRAVGIISPIVCDDDPLNVSKWMNWSVALVPETDDEEWQKGQYSTSVRAFVETSLLEEMFTDAFADVRA